MSASQSPTPEKKSDEPVPRVKKRVRLSTRRGPRLRHCLAKFWDAHQYTILVWGSLAAGSLIVMWLAYRGYIR